MDVLRLNDIARKSQKKAALFWSDGFGDEAIFYSDFGDHFEYRVDAKPSSNNDAVPAAATGAGEVKPIEENKVISYPTLRHALTSVKWKDIPYKLFPLSKIFVKQRLLQRFKDSHHGHHPKNSDENTLKSLLDNLSTENEIDLTTVAMDEENINWQSECNSLCQFPATSIIGVSVMGSWLSQEVIKCISRSGTPGNNCWVYNGQTMTVKAFSIK